MYGFKLCILFLLYGRESIEIEMYLLIYIY